MDIIPCSRINIHRVKKTSIYKMIVYILLVLPDDIFSLGAIYANKTPSYIAYRWLDYSFGIVFVFIIVWGIWAAYVNRDRKIWCLLLLLLAREIFIALITVDNCFAQNSYEIYLTIFIGLFVVEILFSISKDLEECNMVFWRIIFLNILTVFFAFVFNHNGIDGRYNASNMDVGSTGTICGIAVVYCLFSEKIKKRYILVIVAVVALFLSGSRVNLLITVATIVCGMIMNIQKKKHISNRMAKKIAIIIGIGSVLGVSVIGYIVFFNGKIPFMASDGSITRMLNALSVSDMNTDGSFVGRTTSIGIGFDIIKSYPLGISGYFSNLQMKTIDYGFPTFPHSIFVDYYIFLGPIIVVFIFFVIYMLVKLFRKDITQFLVLLYTFIFLLISGGPIVNFKIIFIYAMIILISFFKSVKCKAVKMQS